MYYAVKRTESPVVLKCTKEEGSIFFNASRQAQVLKATSRCGLQFIFARGRCHLLLGLKQGYPLYSPYGCRLGYHQSEAWLVEQKALPPQLYETIIVTYLA